MLRSNELTYLCELKLAKADFKRLSITEQTFVKCNVELSLLEMVEIDPLDIHVAEARETVHDTVHVCSLYLCITRVSKSYTLACSRKYAIGSLYLRTRHRLQEELCFF